MARIPLAQIPNVPGLPDPVLTKYPDVRVDLSDMARRLQQGEIRQGSFDGPAEGLQAMGQAVGKTGQVFQALGERMADAKDQSDLAQAQLIMRQARANHANEMLEQPESQWVPSWENKYRPQMEQQLDGLHLSPRARSQVVPQLVQFDATTRTDLTYEAHKQAISRYATNVSTNARALVQAGQYDQAAQSVADAQKTGLFSPEAAASLQQHIAQVRSVQAAKDTENRNLWWVNNQPWRVIEALKPGSDQTEAETMFPGATEQQKYEYLEKARRNFNQSASVSLADFGKQVTSGAITTEAEVNAFVQANPVLEADKAGLLKTLQNTVGPLDMGAYNRLVTEASTYRPETDSTGEKRANLQREINLSLPTTERELVTARLREAASPDHHADPRVAAGLGILHRYSMEGYLGARTVRPGRGRSPEPAPFEQVSAVDQREMQLREGFEQWLQQNPKASLPEAQQYIHDQVKELAPFHKNDDFLNGSKPDAAATPFPWNVTPGSGPSPARPGSYTLLPYYPSEREPQPVPLPDRPSDGPPQVELLSGQADEKASAPAQEFTARATGYHPVAPGSAEYRMEGGSLDRAGHPIHTLEDFREGKAPYVTVAMDSAALPYGTRLESPDFPGVPFRVADTGSAFQGQGTSRIDIARRNARGANSPENNRPLRFKILS